jgi:hypothetical protein
MTLSDVIGIFQTYATNEGLIFHFEAREQMPNLSNEENIGTDALMQVVVSSLSPSFDTTSVTLDFYFLKQLERDRTNYLSVMSDTTLLSAEFQQWMEIAIGSLQGVNIAVNGSAMPVNNFDLDYTAGVTLNVNIVFANDGQCVIPPPPACNPTEVSINDVEVDEFVSGSSINVHLFDVNGDVTPISVNVDELNIDVELPVTTCEDGEVEIRDTDGNLLHTVTVSSGATEEQTIADSEYRLLNSNGVKIGEGTIPAEGFSDITAPDATYTVQYENGTPIESGSIVSGGSVLVEVTDPVVCEDVDVYVGEANVGSFPSGSDVFVTIIQDGLEVIPDDVTVTGDEIDITLANTPKNLTWELNYNGTDDVIFIIGTVSNVGTLTSGSGSNVGTITVSTDGVTYGALSFPFTPVNGTTYYFKRSTATVNGTYTMTGTYV